MIVYFNPSAHVSLLWLFLQTLFDNTRLAQCRFSYPLPCCGLYSHYPVSALSGSAREILEPTSLSAIYLFICSVYDIYSCNDPVSASSGSAREILEPTSLSATYLFICSVYEMSDRRMNA